MKKIQINPKKISFRKITITTLVSAYENNGMVTRPTENTCSCEACTIMPSEDTTCITIACQFNNLIRNPQ